MQIKSFAVAAFFLLPELFLNGIKRKRKSRNRAGVVIGVKYAVGFYLGVEGKMMVKSFVQKFHCCRRKKHQQQ